MHLAFAIALLSAAGPFAGPDVVDTLVDHAWLSADGRLVLLSARPLLAELELCLMSTADGRVVRRFTILDRNDPRLNNEQTEEDRKALVTSDLAVLAKSLSRVQWTALERREPSHSLAAGCVAAVYPGGLQVVAGSLKVSYREPTVTVQGADGRVLGQRRLVFKRPAPDDDCAGKNTLYLGAAYVNEDERFVVVAMSGCGTDLCPEPPERHFVIPLPKHAQANESLAAPTPDRRSTRIDVRSGVELVLLHGGVSWDEAQPGKTRLDPFWLGRTPVTAEQYARCADSGACANRPPTGGDEEYCNRGAGRNDYPINCVSWHEATAFCAWIGGRLPTAPERVWAASSEDLWFFPWGNAGPHGRVCNRIASGRDTNPTCPVGAFPAGASRQGIQDLVGNVFDWTTTDLDGRKRLVGVWFTDAHADTAVTHVGVSLSEDPEHRDDYIGFRCAMDAGGDHHAAPLPRARGARGSAPLPALLGKLAPDTQWGVPAQLNLDGDDKPDAAVLGTTQRSVVVATQFGSDPGLARLFTLPVAPGSQGGICAPPGSARIKVEPCQPGRESRCRAAPGQQSTQARALEAIRLEAGDCDAFHFYFDGEQVRWWRR